MPLTRRALLSSAILLHAQPAPKRKPLRGIFPIAQTPFTNSNLLDLDTLTAQLDFIRKTRVHGFVWPQLASEWSTLTEQERLAGAAALGKASKSDGPALVLGVQAGETPQAVRYAKHATDQGADALIALPPPGKPTPAQTLDYYKQIGASSPLPLFVQAVGEMSVETILELRKAVPTLKFIKDEAGEPLLRMAALAQGSNNELGIFTGGHGRTMLDEMHRGSAGTMPAASFADLYAAAWDHFHAGNRKKAMELFSVALLFVTEVSAYGIESLKYILQLRGVFHNTNTRSTTPSKLDAKGKEVLAQILAYAKPHLRA